MSEAIEQFRAHLAANGLHPPEIIFDGRIHRFGTKPRDRDNGWYYLHQTYGEAGCFDGTGPERIEWRDSTKRNRTPAETEEFRRRVEQSRLEQDQELARRRERAKQQAQDTFNRGSVSQELQQHGYLSRKGGIASHGAKLYAGSLVISEMRCTGSIVVPIRNASGEIVSLQFIAENGDKRFLPGGELTGCYHHIGKFADVICVAEGFATGASVHEATGYSVAVAFNAGNLLPVAKVVRANCPDAKLILCADNDQFTDGNPGVKKATEAAQAIGALLAIPQFSDLFGKPTDFNDMAVMCGLEAVESTIANAREMRSGDCQPEQESAPAKENAYGVNMIRASEVNPEPIAWLWRGWLAAGKMHIFGGAPGTGKTTISMGLAATVTTGGKWPDGTRSIAGNVVIWSGEDDPADTLVPRLTLSGADLSRVYFIAGIRDGNERRSFDPAKDMEPLRRKLTDIGDVRLLIVDPVVSAVIGEGNSNPQVRRSLQPLIDIGKDVGCAVIGITHFRKSSAGSDPVERINGSIAYGALARVVLVAAKHQEEGEDGRTVRLFCRAKSNIGPDDGGFEYDLHQAELKTHPGIIASSVMWGNAVQGAARELLATAETLPEDGSGESVGSVTDWMQRLLTEEGGSIDRRDVMRAANAMGYKERTVHRAREKLRLQVRQTGFGKDKRSLWTWPDSSMPASIVPIMPLNITGTHGTIGKNGGTDGFVEVEI